MARPALFGKGRKGVDLADEYDIIIAGGGTAGCVLTDRLSADGSRRILLLEAGRNDTNLLIHVPAGFAKLTGSAYDWGFDSAPQKHCNDRVIPLAQGKVIGGGGSINAQVFTRGVPEDYDLWASEYGCPGWSADEVWPYFVKSEGNDRLAGPMHGTDGPLGASDPINPHPLTRAWVQACQQYGLPYNADFNAGNQLGAGYYQNTTRNGRRCSAAIGYLRPARKRRNVTVVPDALVSRVIVEGGRATGVDVITSEGRHRIRAADQVIVSAGAYNTPKLLQLSGIGDPEVLRQAGVDIVHPLVGVGRNLHDHCDLDIVYELHDYVSMDRFDRARPATAAAGMQYLAFRRGPLASTVVEGGAFSYADPDAPYPDMQFHFLPASGAEAGIAATAPGYGVTLNSYFTRPRSRGTVAITSADPTKPPRIDPNFLADDYDVEMSIIGVKQSREIMAQPAVARHVKKELFDDKLTTADDYVEFVRSHGRTSYHPVGSCKMGTDDESVVDPQLRVHGLAGLRVIDSSVMPRIISSNTQAPTVMIAEKAADLIMQNS